VSLQGGEQLHKNEECTYVLAGLCSQGSVGRYVLCRYLVTASLVGQCKVVSFVLRLGTVNKQIIVVAVVYSC
jgi:hypothetical protein